MLLAIDTSTPTAGLALWGEDGLGAVLAWEADQNHTRQLWKSMDFLLELQGLKPADLRGIAAGLGPGRFNGLRVGLSAAKGLCLALGRPIVGVDTLEATAYPYRDWGPPVCAVIAAGRGQLCAALYGEAHGRWQRQEGPILTDLESLCRLVDGPALFCGELTSAQREALRSRLGPRAVIAAPAGAPPRAVAIAEIAWGRLQVGETDDLATLQPIYLRRPPLAPRLAAPESPQGARRP